MGLDLWFRQDVARILAAAWETMQAAVQGTGRGTVATPEDEVALAYQRGFQDALRAVAVAFGLAGGESSLRTGSGGPTQGQPGVYRGVIPGPRDDGR